jgi:hypothetical protein
MTKTICLSAWKIRSSKNYCLINAATGTIFVVGPNAAGKLSFIRTRINELERYEIIMTDVFKGSFCEGTASRKDIVLETVFDDASFRNLVDDARNAGYNTSLIVLFLDSIQHSIERVAFRCIEQSGL